MDWLNYKHYNFDSPSSSTVCAMIAFTGRRRLRHSVYEVVNACFYTIRRCLGLTQ